MRLSTWLLTTAAVAPMPALAAPKKPASKPAPKKPAPAAPAKPADPLAGMVISEGKEAILVDRLKPETTTLVLFYQPASTEDVAVLEEVLGHARSDPRAALRLVRLPSLEAPIAKQYQLEGSPTAFVYDRNKNLLGRASTVPEMGRLVGQALKVARLKWVDESDPSAPETFRIFGGGRARVPEIMKTMSLRPEIMELVAQLSRFHFSDGFLPRRTHEMIASYVSALNKCKY
jgi:hypothetical protein